MCYLFNDISASDGLINVEIWVVCKCFKTVEIKGEREREREREREKEREAWIEKEEKKRGRFGLVWVIYLMAYQLLMG